MTDIDTFATVIYDYYPASACMERYCPDATMLNYTNRMVLVCRAMQRETSIQLTGLCHSAQGISEMLAGWIGTPYVEITYTCAGIIILPLSDIRRQTAQWLALEQRCAIIVLLSGLSIRRS
ncbi:MAG: hypothetical protein ABI901_03635, partial [Roseiflexaceae bacterium]